eukprot:GSChrysophyteH1.ASY1.ANO1.736.1 assembled CDS
MWQPEVDGENYVSAIPASNGKTADENFEEYKKKYQQSLADPVTFWKNTATELVDWFHPFESDKFIGGGDLWEGNMHWFRGGKLNISYNCVDRHVSNGRADQTALLWEGDEPGLNRTITYKELQCEVSRIANVMKSKGIKKGDVVTIYMPMIPELAMVMLACVRIGAVHSIVFAGFSAESLRGRITDCSSRWVFTADEGMRGGRNLRLKDIVDAALDDASADLESTSLKCNMKSAPPYCPCEWIDAEDAMFILYTSGSTGKPKGLAHTTGGYLVHAALSTKTSFDIQEGDIYACVADCGWITGHTYIVYGPLCLGTTSVMFESIPTYPNPYRYWDVVQRHKITQFYTAPTAVRALMRYPTEPIEEYDLSSLRILGTVGEPINPEAWRWYYKHVGREKCTIADTYWQTETGGHVAVNIPGAANMKPGSCALPYYGIEFAVVDSTTGKELEGNDVEGVLCIKRPWPSMARTVYGDHDRYMNVYLRPYPGFYFTGDGCRRDSNGYYNITGRVDDVINPSGHRIGTAEVESALVATAEVSEAAVVGFPHEIKALVGTLKQAVRSAIGPFATPDMIVFTDLPKTRSGKIMRRILRKVAAGESDSIGDTSTLADQTIVNKLISEFEDSKTGSGKYA